GDYVVVVHADLLEGRRPCCMTEMTDVPWVFCPNLPVYRRWAEQSGLDFGKVTEHELANMSMISSAVRAGAGASVMIEAMVEDDIATGKLVAIETAVQPGLGYHVVTAAGVLPAKVKTFRKWLLSQSDAA
ncbi:MAG: LysR substrate-binding domain-containing protein, partial [Pseudomonadota bacterium]